MWGGVKYPQATIFDAISQPLGVNENALGDFS